MIVQLKSDFNAANNPRDIKHLVVHCTGTAHTATIDSIERYWRENLKWKSPGYHYIIKANGDIISLLPENLVSNGVGGFNSSLINICYIGGLLNDKTVDTRTCHQKSALRIALHYLKNKYPNAVIQGHRDFPGVKKACPCFDAKTEYADIKSSRA